MLEVLSIYSNIALAIITITLIIVLTIFMCKENHASADQ